MWTLLSPWSLYGITFNDSNLEQAVRSQLGIPSDPLTQADMDGLTWLNADGTGISDLTGLETAVNLTQLWVSHNTVTDLTPISALPLQELAVADNGLSDLAPLSGISSLTHLSINDNQVSDLSPLAGLTGLKSLYADNNQISDISALAGMTLLENLGLGTNQITDISALSGMSALVVLFINDNPISDISALSGKSAMVELWADNNQISDISVLSSMTVLDGLGLGANQLTDVSALSGLTAITFLRLNQNEIVDVSPLSGLTQLTVLQLGYNRIEDISALSGLTALETLELEQNYISDISALTGLVNLVQVKLGLNFLDFSAGSQPEQNLNTLTGNGAAVSTESQGRFVQFSGTADTFPDFARQHPQPFGGTFRALTRGASGRLIGVGDDGLIGVSDDGGVTWQERSLEPNRVHLLAISHDGGDPGRLLAAGADGEILESLDNGETWSSQFKDSDPRPSGSWLYSVIQEAGQTFAAGGDHILRLDGGTWNVVLDLAGGYDFRDLLYHDGNWVALAIGPNYDASHFFVSTDNGDSWQEAASTADTSLFALAHGAGTYVAVGNNRSFTATDPVGTWNGFHLNLHALDVAFDGSQFVAAGEWSERLAVSADGETWDTQSFQFDFKLRANLHALVANPLVAVGEGLTTLLSSDGLSWTHGDAIGGFHATNQIIHADGTFISVGSEGKTFRSTDGQTWNLMTLPASHRENWLNAVAYGNGRAVAIGDPNDTFISTDLENWSVVQSGTGFNVVGMCYGNGLFVAVGEGGSIATSADGTNWQSQVSPVSDNLDAVTYGNGRYVAVGLNGTAVYSDDGMSWTQSDLKVGGASSTNFHDVVFADGLFLAVGNENLVRKSPDGEAWELVDPSASDISLYWNDAHYDNGLWFLLSNSFIAYSTDLVRFQGHYLGREEYPHLASGDNQLIAAGRWGSFFASSLDLAPERLDSGPRTLGVIEGTTATIHSGVFGAEPMAFSWSDDGGALPGESGRNVIIPNVSMDDAGLYSVNASNDLGNLSVDINLVVLSDGPVTIPDPALEQAIRDALGIPGDPLTAENLLQLTSLSSSYVDIRDLTGLENALNLVHLNLDSNSITDLNPLANLGNLRSLDLAYNQISDLSPIAGLGNLEFLNVERNWLDLTTGSSSRTLLDSFDANGTDVLDSYQNLLSSIQATPGSFPDFIYANPMPFGGGLEGMARGTSGRLVAVGNKGLIQVSDDNGETWYRKAPDQFQYHLRSISHDGGNPGRYIAGGDGGILIESNDDGETWIPFFVPGESKPSEATIAAIAQAGDTALAVANGAILRMSGGSPWALVLDDSTYDFHEVIAHNGQFIAIALDSNQHGHIFVSDDDGVSWTKSDHTVPSGVETLLAGPDKFLLSGWGDHYTATDILGEWTAHPAPFHIRDLAYQAPYYIAVGHWGNRIAISQDGADWSSEQPYLPQQPAANLNAIVTNPLAAIGGGQSFFISQNATNWEQVGILGGFESISEIQFVNDQFVVVGSESHHFKSDDGLSWERIPSSAQGARGWWLNGVAYGNGIYLAIAGELDTLVSSDLELWEHIGNGPSFNPLDVAFGNGIFVVTGESSEVSSTTDGNIWNQHQATNAEWLASIAYGDGRFVAVGDGTSIFYSDDGMNWTRADSKPGHQSWRGLRKIEFADGLFVAVGNENLVRISRDGINWEAADTDQSGFGDWWEEVSYANGVWFLSGQHLVATTDFNHYELVDTGYGETNWRGTGALNQVVLGTEGGSLITANFSAPGRFDSGTRSIVVIEGTSVSLNAGVYGAEPMSFQWSDEQGSLNGQTSRILDLGAVQVADSGVYSVNATNNDGGLVIDFNLVVLADGPASFADPNLEAAVADSLGVPVGEVQNAQLLEMTGLWAADYGISDLSGLEKIPNLVNLNLDYNAITDLEPLRHLTRLQNLILPGNQVSDLAPLENLGQLRSLNLSDNSISDISPLAGMDQMEQLLLDNNQVSDLSPISSLTSLRNLSLENNLVHDLSPLAGLVRLEQLNLAGNRVSDITSLQDLTGFSDASPFFSGTTLNLDENYLNLQSGSSPLGILDQLSGALEITVSFDNQNEPLQKSIIVGPATSGYDLELVVFEPWSVSNPHDWIQVTPTSGTGSATLTVTLAPNNTGADRSGTFQIGDLTHTVSQRVIPIIGWGLNDRGAGHLPESLGAVSEIHSTGFKVVAEDSNGAIWIWPEDHPQSVLLEPNPGLSGYDSIVFGGPHIFGLINNEIIPVYGFNNSGGTSFDTAIYTLPPELDGNTNVEKMLLAETYGLALLIDGQVVAWGSRDYGQASNPINPGVVTDIAISSNFNTTLNLILLDDGTVQYLEGPTPHAQGPDPSTLTQVSKIFGWGGILFAAIHTDGSVSVWGDSSTPGVYSVPVGLTGVDQLYFNGSAMLALKSDGTLVEWGDFGDGYDPLPEGLTDIVQVEVGGGHFVARKADNTVVAWGNSGQGQTMVPDGLTNVIDIAAGVYFSYALKADGSLEFWGYDYPGQQDFPEGLTQVLGVATGSDETFITLPDGSLEALGQGSVAFQPEEAIPGDLGPILSAVSNINGWGTFAAMQRDGIVRAWGTDWFGTSFSEPGPLNSPVKIATRPESGLALLADQSVVEWGEAPNAGLLESVPEGLSGVIDIDTGSYHALALKEDGTVVQWGWLVANNTPPPDGLSDVARIACGDDHSLALLSDGSVIGWGRNDEGQIDIPVFARPIVDIDAGNDFSLALHDDGSVTAWGEDIRGKIRPPEGLTGVVDLAAAANFTVAVLDHGPDLGLTEITHADQSVGYPAASYLIGVYSNTTWSVAESADWVEVNRQQSQGNDILVVSVDENRTIFERSTTLSIGGVDHILTQEAGPPFFELDEDTQHRSSAGGSYDLVIDANAPWTIGESLDWLELSSTSGDGPATVTVTLQPNTSGNLRVGTLDVNGSVQEVRQYPAQIMGWGYNPRGIDFYRPELTGVTQIFNQFAGFNLFGAIDDTGEFKIWGDTSIMEQPIAMAPPTLDPNKTVKDILIPSIDWALILYTDGTLESWGQPNEFANPSPLPAITSNVQDVASIGNATVVIDNNGVVYGSGNDNNRGFLTDIPTDLIAEQVVLSNLVSLFLLPDGSLAAYGDNRWGVLDIPAGLTDVRQIALWGVSALALKTDGSIVAWGSTDGVVPDLPVEWITPNPTNPIIKMATGAGFVVILRQDGSVSTWGLEDVASETPTDSGYLDIAAAPSGALAIKPDGTLTYWGLNPVGPLDIPENLPDIVEIQRSLSGVFALLADGTLEVWGATPSTEEALESLENVVDFESRENDYLALLSDGTLLSNRSSTLEDPVTDVVQINTNRWGSNARLVDGTVLDLATGTDSYFDPPVTNAVDIFGGYIVTYAKLDDGSLIANNGASAAMRPPVDLAGEVVSLESTGFTAYALLDDGSLAFWGNSWSTPMAFNPDSHPNFADITRDAKKLVPNRSQNGMEIIDRSGSIVAWNNSGFLPGPPVELPEVWDYVTDGNTGLALVGETGVSDKTRLLGPSDPVDAIKGRFVLGVHSRIDWSVENHPEWMSPTETDGRGSRTFVVNLADNLSAIPRTGAISINGESLEITQAGAVAFLEIDPANQSIEAAGDSYTLSIISNDAWSISEALTWVSVSPTSGVGDGTLTVTVLPNLEITERSGNLTIGSLTHTVTQSGADAFVTINPPTRLVDFEGTTYSIQVASNTDWTVAESLDWAVVDVAGGTGNGEVSVMVDANPLALERDGIITIGTAEHRLTQGAAPAETTLPSTSESLAAEGGSFEIEIQSNTDWTVMEDLDWIAVSPVGGNGDGTVTVTVTGNPDTVQRVGELTINGQTFTVTQAPAEGDGGGGSGGGGEETDPPSAPTGLMAGDGISTESIQVVWDSSGAGVTYNLYRSLEDDPTTADPIALNLTELSFQDSLVANGVVYYYFVTAVNAIGESAFSTGDAGSLLQLWEIRAVANIAEAGSLSGDGSFAHGEQVTLIATENEGYRFKAWEENGEALTTDPTYTFAAAGGRNLTARFVELFDVTVLANPPEGGIASGSGIYEDLDPVTAVATPAAGYRLDSWNVEGLNIISKGSYSFYASRDRTITANFVRSRIFVEDGPSGNPPEILEAVFSGSAWVGSDLRMFVSARGASPLTFLWEKDGVIIPGVDGQVLDIQDAQISDSGEYRITVTNPFGSASQTGTLQVKEPPVNPALEMFSNPAELDTIPGEQWIYVNWLGLMKIDDFPWIYHTDHGWLYIQTDETKIDDFFAHHEDLGWLWFSQEARKDGKLYIWRFDTQSFLWHWGIDEEEAVSWYYQYATGTWIGVPWEE